MFIPGLFRFFKIIYRLKSNNRHRLRGVSWHANNKINLIYPLQVDHVGKPSWQAQIRGHKIWTLEPPPECYFQCQSMAVTVDPGNISKCYFQCQSMAVTVDAGNISKCYFQSQSMAVKWTLITSVSVTYSARAWQ